MAAPLAPHNGCTGADRTMHHGVVVRGVLPAVSGRLLGLLGGVVHSVAAAPGRTPVYQSHRVEPRTRTHGAACDIIVFGGSILAFADGSLARQISSNLTTVTPVDLAGRSRRLSGRPRQDRITGDLHLLAASPDGPEAHVVVSAGALTRRDRPLTDRPSRVRDLAVAGDVVLFACDGFVGLGSRDFETPVQWLPTKVGAPQLVYARSVDDIVVAITTAPSLEKWVIHPPSSTLHREVLDPTSPRIARTNHGAHDTAFPLLWTISDRAVDTHDLVTGRRVHRTFGQGRPGDLCFVTDPARGDRVDGGWLVGLVHQASGRTADLVVLDAADISRPAVATARMPGPVPAGLRTAWITESCPNLQEEGRP